MLNNKMILNTTLVFCLMGFLFSQDTETEILDQLNAINPSYKLSGSVVDENGNLLYGVTCSIKKHMFDFNKNKSSIIKLPEETVEGYFQIELEGAVVIECIFSKEGYKIAKLIKSLHQIKAEAISSGNSITASGNNEIVKNDLLVLLIKE